MTNMDLFFAQSGVHLHHTKKWSDGGHRHWFSLDPHLTVDDVRSLLKMVPVGAYVRCFDPEYESPSDPGAWIAFQRCSDGWTAKFSNHGWSSAAVPVDFEDVALIFWQARDFDYGKFLGRHSENELMAHSGLSGEAPKRLESDPASGPARYLRDRAAAINQQPPA